MAAYIILLIFPCLVSGMKVGNANARYYLPLIGIFYVIFIGFRDHVGADWPGYEHIYNIVNENSNITSLSYNIEPGFVLLNMVSNHYDFWVYGVNFIVAVIFVSGLLRLAEKMPIPWLAIVAVTPYLCIAVAMSAMRQAAAIGIFFHIIASWEKGIVSKASLLILSVLFHYSAVISSIFVLSSMKINKYLKLVLLGLGGYVALKVFARAGAFEMYNDRYFVSDVFSSGAVQHVLLNVIPAVIYLLNIRRWKNSGLDDPRIYILAIASLISILILPISSTVVDRLALYFSPIQMIVYSSIPIVFRKSSYAFLIACYSLITMVVWFVYANNSFAFLPYRNILL